VEAGVPDEPTPTAPLSGGCMCGAVRFAISEPLLGALYCHCKRCQRRTGTGFSVNALTRPGTLEVMEGASLIGVFDPGDGGWRKSFCTRCGSHLYTTNPENPELVGVRVGTIDQDPGVRPGFHQFVDYAPPWAPVPDDGLRRFPERAA
jgi:hypothetical protein